MRGYTPRLAHPSVQAMLSGKRNNLLIQKENLIRKIQSHYKEHIQRFPKILLSIEQAINQYFQQNQGSQAKLLQLEEKINLMIDPKSSSTSFTTPELLQATPLSTRKVRELSKSGEKNLSPLLLNRRTIQQQQPKNIRQVQQQMKQYQHYGCKNQQEEYSTVAQSSCYKSKRQQLVEPVIALNSNQAIRILKEKSIKQTPQKLRSQKNDDKLFFSCNQSLNDDPSMQKVVSPMVRGKDEQSNIIQSQTNNFEENKLHLYKNERFQYYQNKRVSAQASMSNDLSHGNIDVNKYPQDKQRAQQMVYKKLGSYFSGLQLPPMDENAGTLLADEVVQDASSTKIKNFRKSQEEGGGNHERVNKSCQCISPFSLQELSDQELSNQILDIMNQDLGEHEMELRNQQQEQQHNSNMELSKYWRLQIEEKALEAERQRLSDLALKQQQEYEANRHQREELDRSQEKRLQALRQGEALKHQRDEQQLMGERSKKEEEEKTVKLLRAAVEKQTAEAERQKCFYLNKLKVFSQQFQEQLMQQRQHLNINKKKQKIEDLHVFFEYMKQQKLISQRRIMEAQNRLRRNKRRLILEEVKPLEKHVIDLAQ